MRDNKYEKIQLVAASSRKNRATYLRKRKKYGKDFEKIIVEMRKGGYFRGLDKKIVIYGILGMLNWVTKWYKSEGLLTVKDISILYIMFQ